MPPRFTHTIDPRALRQVAPTLTPARAEEVAKAVGTALHLLEPEIGRRAAAHFVAQCAHECVEFQVLREIWNPRQVPVQAGYWRRRELQGDGPLFPELGFIARGGGMIMTTGRSHFRRGRVRLRALGVPVGRSWRFVADHSGEPWMAALLAAIWWSDHFPASMPAREWTVERVTRTVNGGTNGLADRRKYTERAMRVRGRLVPRPVR